MALSGNFSFTLTREEIIGAALRKIGVIAEGQTVSDVQLDEASQALNVMLKAFQSDGLPLWYMKTGYLLPVSNTNLALLGEATTHWTDEIVITRLTANAAALAATIEVETAVTAGPEIVDVWGVTTNSDQMGIELDDDTIHWTSITSGGGTSTLNFPSAIPSAASTGNRVYTYSSTAARPEGVQNVWRVTSSSGLRVPVEPMPIAMLQGISFQQTQGYVTHWNYIETINEVPGTGGGRFRIWPRFGDGRDYLEVWYQHPFDDLSATGDSLSFPSTWFEAIIYGLAMRLADEYGIPDSMYKRVASQAVVMKGVAEESTNEGLSLYIQPSMNVYQHRHH